MKLTKYYSLLIVFTVLATNCRLKLSDSSGDTTRLSRPFIETGKWVPVLNEQNKISVPSTANPTPSELVAYYDDSLWLTSDGTLYKYNIQTKKISPYVLDVENKTGNPSEVFLVSSKKVLWALGLSFKNPLSTGKIEQEKAYWILRYYDSVKDTFTEIHDIDGMLYTKFTYPKRLIEDEFGNLWILLWGGDSNNPSRVIYYDIKENRASLMDIKAKVEGFPVGAIKDMVFDKRGKLWLSLQAEYLPNDPNPNYHIAYYWEIFCFDPKVKKAKSYGQPKGSISGSPDLFVDSHNKIWTSSIALLDLQSNKPQWTPSVQPFQLFTDSFGWSPPGKVYETSDGALWLKGDFGLKVYYPPTNQWYEPSFIIDEEHYFGSMVIEDDRHQIWAFENGQIYKMINQ